MRPTKPTDSERAAILARIRELILAGNTPRYIAEKFNREQVPTLSGRRNAKWGHGAVWTVAEQGGYFDERDSRASSRSPL
jgi:Recombinase